MVGSCLAILQEGAHSYIEATPILAYSGKPKEVCIVFALLSGGLCVRWSRSESVIRLLPAQLDVNSVSTSYSRTWSRLSKANLLLRGR
jgi:hypothetical protein